MRASAAGIRAALRAALSGAVRAVLAVPALLLAACATTPRAGAPADPAGDVTLTIASYNIRHGRGNDDRVDLARTASVLRALEADVIGLQEVDERVARSGAVDEAAELGRLLAMQHAFGAFMPYQGGRYGMAILSRHPIASSRAIRLPDGNEPRVALEVRVRLPGDRELAIVNVHFDWVASDSFRLAQASALARELDTLTVPYVVLGDFNDLPASPTLALFRARATEAAKPAAARMTFPSPAPEREIDFVFVAPAGAWRNAAAHVIDERVASDHRPVRARATLRATPQGPSRR